MAYRYGDRKQRALFPQSVDEYIPQDAPVRAYDVFVDSLNLTRLAVLSMIPKSCLNCCSMDTPMEFAVLASWKERPITIFRLSGSQAD